MSLAATQNVVAAHISAASQSVWDQLDAWKSTRNNKESTMPVGGIVEYLNGLRDEVAPATLEDYLSTSAVPAAEGLAVVRLVNAIHCKVPDELHVPVSRTALEELYFNGMVILNAAQGASLQQNDEATAIDLDAAEPAADEGPRLLEHLVLLKDQVDAAVRSAKRAHEELAEVADGVDALLATASDADSGERPSKRRREAARRLD